MIQRYKNLATFFSSWFHQDFDLNGETIEEIVSTYLQSADPNEVEILKKEIRQFLSENAGCIQARFEENFDLDVDPLGFASSIEEFLMSIYKVLKAS